MKHSKLKLDVQNKICIITINSPENLNALNVNILREFENAFIEIETNNDINVVIITGAGKSFVAGADISEMVDFNYDEAKEFSILGSKVFNKIEKSNKVFIAAVNGFALGGGCELAMACDIRIASDKAKFGQPEINLGIIPGFSGTQRLPRLVGVSKAKEMIFTGKIIDANEAFRIGLVSKVVEYNNLIDECMLLADVISKKPSNVLSNAKESINNIFNNSLDIGIEKENSIFASCFDSANQKEGMKAFIGKREPNFE